MSDEFGPYPDMVPDFINLVLAKEIPPSVGVDPYDIMMKKKKEKEPGVVTDAKTPEWPEKDVKALENFCKQHNILGFNCGKMSPIAALAMLKKKIGVVDGPLSERIPFGYDKPGKKPINNPSYTYMTMVSKKTVLHG